MQPQLPTMYSLTSLQQDFPDELPSWDFSQDVLGGLEQFVDSASSLAGSEAADAEMREAIAAAPATAEPSTLQAAAGNLPKRASSSPLGGPDTRKQKQNRQAQQRFRQRQKARAEALEAQVAATTARLQELRDSQRRLEARNALLETVASLNVSDETESDMTMGERDWSDLPTTSADSQQTITLTVLAGQELVKTVQDVGSMAFTEFATLYAAYAQRIGQCLSETSVPEPDPAVNKEMCTWTCQCSSLVVFLAVGNLKNFLAYSTSRLDGSVGPSANQLSEAWYQDYLAALHLTEAQEADIMQLRALFYARLGALSRERKELLRQAPAGATQTAAHASTRLADINTLAQQLHDNSAAEFKTYMQLTSAYRRGILTARQQAVCIAKAFPYIADDPRTFELIAARRLEVPLSVLTQPPGLDDFEHNTNWSRVANYLKAVTKSNLHEHNQLVSS